MILATAGLLLLALPAGAFAHGGGLTGTLVEEHGHRFDGKQVGKTYALRSSGGCCRSPTPSPSADRPARASRRRRRGRAGPAGPGPRGGRAAPHRSRRAGAALAARDHRDDARRADAGHDGRRRARRGLHGRRRPRTRSTSSSPPARRASSGACGADGDVAGPLAIGVSTIGCEHYDIADAADAAARAAGFAVDGIRPRALLHCRTRRSATSAGSAQLPGRRTWTNGFARHDGGRARARPQPRRAPRELGALHAPAARRDAVADLRDDEYGDPFDVMGIVEPADVELAPPADRPAAGRPGAAHEGHRRRSRSSPPTTSRRAGRACCIVPRKAAASRSSSSLAVELRSLAGAVRPSGRRSRHDGPVDRGSCPT